MPTYITLINYTQQGIEAIEDGPNRLDEARALIESMGGTFDQWFLTMGEYDAVAVTTAPDGATAAKSLLTIAKDGAVRTTTFEAFPEDEYRDIIAGLP